jgi:hypothetical protein
MTSLLGVKVPTLDPRQPTELVFKPKNELAVIPETTKLDDISTPITKKQVPLSKDQKVAGDELPAIVKKTAIREWLDEQEQRRDTPVKSVRGSWQDRSKALALMQDELAAQVAAIIDKENSVNEAADSVRLPPIKDAKSVGMQPEAPHWLSREVNPAVKRLYKAHV